jgi:hypothetical protein
VSAAVRHQLKHKEEKTNLWTNMVSNVQQIHVHIGMGEEQMTHGLCCVKGEVIE